MKKITFLAIITLLFACNSEPQKQVETQVEQPNPKTKKAVIGLNNYAVIWKWATDDKQLVEDNMIAIADEMTELWKNGVMENAYYDSDAKIDKLGNFPNISFFIKAKTMEDAEMTLNGLKISQKGIAKYNLFPVGNKWLGRKAEVISKKGLTRSFAAVWASQLKIEGSDQLVLDQNAMLMKLYEAGSIENVYFDIEGTQKINDVTDFVFFVNANSEREAKAICDNLPFAKNNLATYQLYQAGVFWLGDQK